MVNGKSFIDILGFRSGISALCGLQCRLDQLGDTSKTDPAGNEGGHGNLVCRVKDRWSSAAGLERAAAERQRRKPIRVRRLESQ